MSLIDEFFREMERLFRRTLRLVEEELRLPITAAGEVEPLTETYETPEEYIIRLDMPGVDPRSIKVRVRGNTISIEAAIKDEYCRISEHALYRRVVMKKYAKKVTLPFSISPENVKARFRNGVLEIRIKKPVVEEGGYEVEIE